MEETKRNQFVGFEYKETTISSEYVSMYLDCSEAFGWEEDGHYLSSSELNLTTIRMKRDRKIVNKMELTRLQRQFEACAREIQRLERSKHVMASICALAVGMIGTVFMAGAVFAITQASPIYWLCVLLAVPALAGWLCPVFLYRYMVRVQTDKVQPLIEAKYDDIYEACEKAHSLL